MCSSPLPLTISPFWLVGGSHEMITFVSDAGIAFTSRGADGTSSCVRQKNDLVLTPSPILVNASTVTL